MTISEAAEYLRITPLTLRNWERKQLISPMKTNGKHRRYSVDDLNLLIGRSKRVVDKKVIGYCRVSTSGQKQDLNRQVELVSNYCCAKGYQFKIISDIGSGLNYTKKGFCELVTLLLRDEVSKVVLNYKDRLIRFGYEIIEQMCKEKGVELVIINDTESKSYEEELVEDVLAVITVFSSKLYGSRSHKTKKIIESNKKDFEINDTTEREIN